MKNPVVVFDVDQVLCNLHRPWIAAYNRDFGDTLTEAGITRWEIYELVKAEARVKIFDYLVGGKLYDTAPLIDGALEGVAAVRETGARVVFASSTGRSQADAKRSWLERHGFLPDNGGDLPQKDLIFAYDKTLLQCDVLVDDHHVNLAGRERRGGILLDKPYNRHVGWAGRTATDWKDVVWHVKDVILWEGNGDGRCC